jgi:hypothetical protein
MIVHQKLGLVTLVALAIVASACGKDKAGGTSGQTSSSASIKGTLQISSIKSTTTTMLNDYEPLASASSDLPSSSGHYSFAKIDGIKVTVNEIRGADANSDNPLVTQTIKKEIELTDDPNALIALNESVSWVAGNYSGIDVRLANAWKIKAYCKTQASGSNFTLVYTTPAGVMTQACTTSSCALPADYGYSSYSFLDDYYTQNGGDPNIATHSKFTIASGDTPTVNLLFDATNTVACWDGSSWSSGAALGAFRGPSTSRRSTLWPDGTAAFAVPVMPLLTYVSKTASEGAPTARTFFASATASYLADPMSFADTETVTLLYNAAGTVIAGNARNLQGTGSPIEMDFDGFTNSTTGTGIDLIASGWYWAGGTATPELVHNRTFTNFILPTTAYSVFSTSYKDGDGCGRTLTDHNGSNPSKACLGTGVTATHYWREAVR